MKRFRHIVRAIVVALLLIVVGLPVGVYVVTATPWVQNEVRDAICVQLSEQLGSQIEIGTLEYHPFNTLTINSVSVRDSQGKSALAVEKVSARFKLIQFLRSGRLAFDYALLDSPDIRVYRETPDSPLNIQSIIDNFKPKNPNKKSTAFDLKVGVVLLRNGRVSYDVLSEPDSLGKINPNHILVKDLSLYAYLRKISHEQYDVEVEALSFVEKSGLEVSQMAVDVLVSPELLAMRNFDLQMPGSSIKLQPFDLEIDGYASIADVLKTESIVLSSSEKIRLSSSDFAWISPVAGKLNLDLEGAFLTELSLQKVDLKYFNFESIDGLRLHLAGELDNANSSEEAQVQLSKFRLSAPSAVASRIARVFNASVATTVQRLGHINMAGTAYGSFNNVRADLLAYVGGARVSVDGSMTTPDRFKTIAFKGKTKVENFNLANALAKADLGLVSAQVAAEGTVRRGKVAAHGSANINRFDWKGYNYNSIALNGNYDGAASAFDVKVASVDPAAQFNVDVVADMGSELKTLVLDSEIANVDLNAINLVKNYEGHGLKAKLRAELAGTCVDDIDGFVALRNISYADTLGNGVGLDSLDIYADRASSPEIITIKSKLLNGKIEGKLVPSMIVPTLRNFVSHIMPSLIEHDEILHAKIDEPEFSNDFTANLRLSSAEKICRFFNLPILVIYPIDICASLSSANRYANITVSAPALVNGDKPITKTMIDVSLNAADEQARLEAKTCMSTKKGPMTVDVNVAAADNCFDTQAEWSIERSTPLNGRINFTTELGHNELDKLFVNTRFAPGDITFGNDIWLINQSTVEWCDKVLNIDDFKLTAEKQSISIQGRASEDVEDQLVVDLKDIELISIFETLDIQNAMIGGSATGTFNISQVFTPEPMLVSDNLHVDSIGYNRCTIGTADIKAHWSNESKSFVLDAAIDNPQGQHSRIWGDIFPMREALDLNFDADYIRVGFMKPFMAAFTSDVAGYVSGKARLYGTFKDIDMIADLYAEDLRLKIDFTNTSYMATDSVHVRPGRIDLDNIMLHDVHGNTAMLSGVLTHRYFHEPRFNFQIKDAKDFLCYNVPASPNFNWHGTIYGSGSAAIVGEPGVVKISTDMTTSRGSDFTFELSDRMNAEQYSFISFNDVSEDLPKQSLNEEPQTPEEATEQYFKKVAEITSSSAYLMDLNVEITPDAKLVIKMDPVGGDSIRAYGSGVMSLAYNSTDNDLSLKGNYILDRGNYNFTLQNIIIKDFKINQGSSITFSGDPYSADLDLVAVYSVTANLNDLDESFSQDANLKNTKVPVEALLKVTGDMRQPDIAFDLNFPHLSSDVYRKVRSIISTDDMMNRQIIYLLAIGRFYTPEYMSTTTNNNELFSMASSTISSQLSNMLGKLSDNWSIAPNLRSDRGDFSDVEVDVMLSSRLLNNRLIFNGNFGYRDKSLNTNQFVGDFDIVYLLNPRGTWRFNAYNRYNDQNYYLRTATTTQGVGIMFRHDFDNLFKRPRSKSKDLHEPKP